MRPLGKQTAIQAAAAAAAAAGTAAAAAAAVSVRGRQLPPRIPGDSAVELWAAPGTIINCNDDVGRQYTSPQCSPGPRPPSPRLSARRSQAGLGCILVAGHRGTGEEGRAATTDWSHDSWSLVVNRDQPHWLHPGLYPVGAWDIIMVGMVMMLLFICWKHLVPVWTPDWGSLSSARLCLGADVLCQLMRCAHQLLGTQWPSAAEGSWPVAHDGPSWQLCCAVECWLIWQVSLIAVGGRLTLCHWAAPHHLPQTRWSPAALEGWRGIVPVCLACWQGKLESVSGKAGAHRAL